jgi:hypothetical protein
MNVVDVLLNQFFVCVCVCTGYIATWLLASCWTWRELLEKRSIVGRSMARPWALPPAHICVDARETLSRVIHIHTYTTAEERRRASESFDYFSKVKVTPRRFHHRSHPAPTTSVLFYWRSNYTYIVYYILTNNHVLLKSLYIIRDGLFLKKWSTRSFIAIYQSFFKKADKNLPRILNGLYKYKVLLFKTFYFVCVCVCRG